MVQVSNQFCGSKFSVRVATNKKSMMTFAGKLFSEETDPVLLTQMLYKPMLAGSPA